MTLFTPAVYITYIYPGSSYYSEENASELSNNRRNATSIHVHADILWLKNLLENSEVVASELLKNLKDLLHGYL